MKRSGPLERRTPLKAKKALRSRSAGRAAATATSRERSPGEPQRTAAPDQGSGAPPRKRIRRRSAKAAAAVEARRDAVMAVHARDRYCVASRSWPDIACGGPLDVHEPLPRSRGGDPTDPDQAILLCRRHHDAAHAHPARAKALGLIR